MMVRQTLFHENSIPHPNVSTLVDREALCIYTVCWGFGRFLNRYALVCRLLFTRVSFSSRSVLSHKLLYLQ